MLAAARFRLCSRVSAGMGAFARSAVIGIAAVSNYLCGVASASFLC